MRVITWNRSLKGLSQSETGKNDFDNDEWETHATILDKMLAWEKKLYDEVKVYFVVKFSAISEVYFYIWFIWCLADCMNGTCVLASKEYFSNLSYIQFFLTYKYKENALNFRAMVVKKDILVGPSHCFSSHYV